MLRLTQGDAPQFEPADETGPIPFRLARADVCLEAKPPADALPDPRIRQGPWRASDRRPLGARNPILEWLSVKATPMRPYLQYLARMDAGLPDSIKDSYSLRHVRRRLALSLFIDFAHDQGLSAAEVATLRSNPAYATLDVGMKIEIGRPADHVVEVATREHAERIVVGSHGRRGIERMLLGSVAERIVRLAPCAVLVVKESAGA